ncbi:MAG: hypothetical protein ACXVB9_15200 [Bdellovibrionota bacterium]
MLELPKHPLERDMNCPICKAAFKTIPLRRGASPDEPHNVVEQHACPSGHVFVTEVGKNEMLAEW